MEEVSEGNGGGQGKLMIFSRKQSCSNFTKKDTRSDQDCVLMMMELTVRSPAIAPDGLVFWCVLLLECVKNQKRKI